MALTVQIPGDLGLSEQQIRDLQEKFQSQVIETIRAAARSSEISPAAKAVVQVEEVKVQTVAIVR
jgi:hypothetical protein